MTEYICYHNCGQYRKGRVYTFEGHVPVLARGAMLSGHLRRVEVQQVKPHKRKRPYKLAEVKLPEVGEDGETGL